MEGRVNRRVDTLIVNIILGRTSQRCQRILQLKAFGRVAKVALHEEVRDSMTAGQQLVDAGKVCVLARSTMADTLASANDKTVFTLRVAASRPRLLAAAATSSEPTEVVIDSCIWPQISSSWPMKPQESSDAACTCYYVKLVYDAKTGRGAAFCTCPKYSAFLCKHICASIMFTRGFEACGIDKGALRLQEDPDATFAEEADNDDNAAFPVDSDDDESDDAVHVEDHSIARTELRVALSGHVQSIKALLMSHPDLPKAEKDEECRSVIYELQDFIHRGDTSIKPPPRAHGFISRRVAGPRPITVSDRAEAFRNAVGIGRPRTTSKAPHRVPLMPLADITRLLTARPSTAASAVTEIESAATAALGAAPAPVPTADCGAISAAAAATSHVVLDHAGPPSLQRPAAAPKRPPPTSPAAPDPCVSAFSKGATTAGLPRRRLALHTDPAHPAAVADVTAAAVSHLPPPPLPPPPPPPFPPSTTYRRKK